MNRWAVVSILVCKRGIFRVTRRPVSSFVDILNFYVLRYIAVIQTKGILFFLSFACSNTRVSSRLRTQKLVFPWLVAVLYPCVQENADDAVGDGGAALADPQRWHRQTLFT